MERVLEEILPIMDIEHDLILSKQGDITIAFLAELPEIFTLSNEEYEAFHLAWIKAIKILPKFCVFHKQDWFLDSKHRPDFLKEDTSFLSQSSERFFNERPYLDHTCYIFLTKKPNGRKLSSSLFSNLLRKSIVPEETLNPQLVQDFLDYAGQFRRILEDSGFVKLARLKDEDLLSTDKKAGVIEKYMRLSEGSLMNDTSFNEGIQIGDKHLQLFSLSDANDLPALCGSRINYDRYSTDKTKFSVGFASTLGQLLPCNHIFNQYIFIEDAQATIKRLESKRLRLQSLSAYSRENTIGRDATNDFLNEALGEQRLPVKSHFNVIVWTESKDVLKDLKNLVSSALAQMDTVAKMETAGAPQIYWAGIPGNEADFPMNDTFDTFAEQACCFLNLETNYRSSLSPVGIRLGDRLTGRPVHVDISDEPMQKGICTNRNKFILGPSGSGKSFFTNHMVRSYYEQGTHIVLVDVGHSYRGLCELVKGYYFTYDERNPIRFNPFFIGEGDVLDTEKKESIKTLLLALWKKDNETFNRSEYVALSSALQLYYEQLNGNRSIFPCFDSFYEFLQNEFVAVLENDKVKEKEFDVANFLYVLRPYYKGGEFDYLLNARENLELLKERFIVFELDNIKDHPILFLNNDELPIPHLIRIGIAHYQFETIRPFLDGNGRLGRLLITLYLMSNNILHRPALYLSDFLERNRAGYYDKLTAARTNNDLHQWLTFFLAGVLETAQNGIDTFNKILKLRTESEERMIAGLGKRLPRGKRLMNYLYSNPVVSMTEISEQLSVDVSTAHRLIKDFEALGIIKEKTGFKRNRIFVFEEYLKLFERK